MPRLQARFHPDAPALVQDATRWSNRDWEDAVALAARELAARGLRAGDRLAIIAENGLVLATLVHAASRLAAWPVILNARLTAREIDAILAHCVARLVACAVDVSGDAERHATRLEARTTRWGAIPEFTLTDARDAAPESVSGDPARDVGAVIYTSGTTGMPKGVLLTHRNLLHVAHWSGALRRLRTTDRVFGGLPISHVFGLASVFLASTLNGACLHLVARFDPAAALALIAREGLTVFQGVPQMFARMLERAVPDGIGPARGAPAAPPAHGTARGAGRAAGRDAASPGLATIRYLSAGGAPLDMTLKRETEALFGVALNNGYGMTELAPTVSTTLIDAYRDDDAVGPPLPGLELRLVDGHGCDVARGDVGTLRVRGPTVMRGYYRDEALTRATIDADGFLDTGDLARQDADGTLFIVGRAKDLIIRSGFNVHPEEVEAVLRAHRDVTIAAVVGRPGVAANEDVVAFVQLAPGADADEAALLAWCAERLAPYKRPARIVALDALPASSTGKVRKAALRELAAALA
ncbi:MAG: AMP-binding protein [Alphaproteobacteria bacterium]|nr:AMP-binding protein [Alphaproteobacteria bacterium]